MSTRLEAGWSGDAGLQAICVYSCCLTKGWWRLLLLLLLRQRRRRHQLLWHRCQLL